MKVWKLKECIEGMRPLVVLHDKLIFSRGNKIYKVGHDLQDPLLLCHLPVEGLVGRLTNNFGFINRVMRLSINHAVIFDNALFIARRSEIWRCDLSNGNLSLDFKIPQNRRLLSFGLVTSANGSKELVFGEYFSNKKMQPVGIWGRKSGPSSWFQRAEFAAGEIEHVHYVYNINDRVYVLAGDMNQAASIWISDTEFKDLRVLARGNQSYRACWIKKIDDRFFLATDTQLQTNHLYDFKMGKGIDLNLPLVSLNGSSIYAGHSEREIFFSTAVEGGKPAGNFIYDLLDRRLGPGILSSKASLMSVDGQGVVKEIYSTEKDKWPFMLGQIGTFTFPTGTMPHDMLYAYSIALKGVHGCCLIFR
jgi:hypothetical protein